MNKKFYLKLLIITVILILISIVFNKCTRSIVNNMNRETLKTITKTVEETIREYSLEEPPINYGIKSSKEAKAKYFEYLKKQIKPIKLSSFISVNDLESDFYNVSGHKMVNWLVAMAYMNMLESMFDINRTDYNDCAVTEKFLEKFNTNLNNYFDIGGEENWVDAYTTDKIIKVTKRWNIMLDGEAEYAMLYRFKYTLDEEGNVDDVILEHIGWD